MPEPVDLRKNKGGDGFDPSPLSLLLILSNLSVPLLSTFWGPYQFSVLNSGRFLLLIPLAEIPAPLMFYSAIRIFSISHAP